MGGPGTISTYQHPRKGTPKKQSALHSAWIAGSGVETATVALRRCCSVAAQAQPDLVLQHAPDEAACFPKGSFCQECSITIC